MNRSPTITPPPRVGANERWQQLMDADRAAAEHLQALVDHRDTLIRIGLPIPPKFADDLREAREFADVAVETLRDFEARLRRERGGRPCR